MAAVHSSCSAASAVMSGFSATTIQYVTHAAAAASARMTVGSAAVQVQMSHKVAEMECDRIWRDLPSLVNTT